MRWDGLSVDPKYLEALFAKYPERLTPQDLEEIFGLSRNTVYRWLQTGVIPAYQVEKTWLIARDQVKDWVGRTGTRSGKVGHPRPAATRQPERTRPSPSGLRVRGGTCSLRRADRSWSQGLSSLLPSLSWPSSWPAAARRLPPTSARPPGEASASRRAGCPRSPSPATRESS
ncbi:helix-turn-helix domain-containing protein [Paenarthrobacter sp. C1]|uniref:helix-turn-helix domain-containing protein n=1 Tax=Paenarthrobacter sp. C1 TaxID=3400220 RepID=UPI003BF4EDC9